MSHEQQGQQGQLDTVEEDAREQEAAHNLPPVVQARTMRLGPADDEALRELVREWPAYTHAILQIAAHQMGNIAVIRALETSKTDGASKPQGITGSKPPIAHGDEDTFIEDPSDQPKVAAPDGATTTQGATMGEVTAATTKVLTVPGEPAWFADARAYNLAHPELVEQFNAGTDHKFVGADGTLDLQGIWNWQAHHGLVHDGKIGRHTSDAATALKSKAKPKATTADAPDKTEAVHTEGGGGAAAWTPPAEVNLTDEALSRMAVELHDVSADKVLHDLGGVIAVAAKLKRNLYNAAEPQGPDRENLVAGIAVVRSGLQSIRDTDPKLVAFKVAVNHKLEALAPYYAQINIMTIESTGGLSTCNVTSLAMSLSTIGKNADAYKEGKRPHLLAVARHFIRDVNSAQRANAGHEAAFSSLRGMRLPDFMELAAVATNIHSADPSEAEIKKAAQFAVDNKTDLSFLAQIAQDFAAKTALSYHTIGVQKTSSLKKIGHAHHAEAEVLVDLRNKAEAHPNDKGAREKYERAKAEVDPHINNAAIEKDLALDDYRSSVMGVVKPLLDSGAGVVAGTYNHFTHCYEMTEDHIRVQDPGQWARADRKVRWDEARALEYFWNYLVLR